jgi:hypothetical protein
MLGENTSRATLYVVMTRGRDTNTGYLGERITGEGDHEHPSPMVSTSCVATPAALLRSIIATRGDGAHTAFEIAASTDRAQLPDRVRRLLESRATAVQRRRTTDRQWNEEVEALVAAGQLWIEQHISRNQDRGPDYGVDR